MGIIKQPRKNYIIFLNSSHSKFGISPKIAKLSSKKLMLKKSNIHIMIGKDQKILNEINDKY